MKQDYILHVILFLTHQVNKKEIKKLGFILDTINSQPVFVVRWWKVRLTAVYCGLYYSVI